MDQTTKLTQIGTTDYLTKRPFFYHKNENYLVVCYEVNAQAEINAYEYHLLSLQIFIECKNYPIQQRVSENLQVHCKYKSPYIMSYLSSPLVSQDCFGCQIFSQPLRQNLAAFIIHKQHYTFKGPFIDYVLKAMLQIFLYLLYLMKKDENHKKQLYYCFDIKNLYVGKDYTIKLGFPGIQISEDSHTIIQKINPDNSDMIVNNQIQKQIFDSIEKIMLNRQSIFPRVLDQIYDGKNQKFTLQQEIDRVKKFLAIFPKQPQDVLLNNGPLEKFDQCKQYWTNVKEHFVVIYASTENQYRLKSLLQKQK